ncbi:MAG: SDR family oxidoreductase [Verrucomicrobiae bacterium]|nr:SDR family oxidoreductase [Verrucomicrobiae bacterium]
MSEPEPKRVLLTGASGYIGGRLLAELEKRGLTVRCLARRPEFLLPKVAPGTEVMAGDVLDRDSLARAMRGVATAYYLVHSMAANDFEETDRRAAHNFAEAAREAGVQRIVYLGGLGAGSELSSHLRSRQEVGNILRSTGVPVIEFRASVIIGSGSLSFEMIRALVERLPMMIAPKWVTVLAQPLAINDLLQYLIAAGDWRGRDNRIFEIGGPDRVSYGDLMREYARQRGLRRVMIRVPLLTPRLSSLWLGLVTPLYARIGRKLIDSIRNPTVVSDDSALQAFAIRPMGVREAIASALRNEDKELAATRWSDALSSGGAVRPWGGTRFGNRLVDARRVRVEVPPATAFEPIRRIGGATGWYFANWLWQLRGWLDLLAGGVGMRRARRDPEKLRTGDVVDCWRVEVLEPDRRLRLTAEMKLPGRAWLEFEVVACGDGAEIRQTASFDPAGFFGLAYWYAIYPLHELLFGGMLRQIAKAATRRSFLGP